MFYLYDYYGDIVRFIFITNMRQGKQTNKQKLVYKKFIGRQRTEMYFITIYSSFSL